MEKGKGKREIKKVSDQKSESLAEAQFGNGAAGLTKYIREYDHFLLDFFVHVLGGKWNYESARQNNVFK